MKKAIIVSDSPNIAHVSLVLAWCTLCEELGNYKVYIHIYKELLNYFDNKDWNFTTIGKNCDKYDLAIITSPSKNNIKIINYLKQNSDCKIIYIYHEPISSFFSKDKIPTLKDKLLRFLIDLFQIVTIYRSDIVLLPSQKAYNIYSKRFIYNLSCKQYFYFPLISLDESEMIFLEKKIYFSFIGNIVNDHINNHSFDRYLILISKIIKENILPDIKFRIATKSSIDFYEKEIKEILNSSNRLEIVSGKIMNNNEINTYYNESFLIWNAYERMNQSGVLVKSYMFGTPVVFLQENSDEFYENYYNSIAVTSNDNMEEFIIALKNVYLNIEKYSNGAKKSFETFFYYKNKIDYFKRILLDNS